eukprot:m.3240 g.3240  ORF g.3240 m.3240 type:complete len:63 (-) comp2647_c0_seq1:108-296(-)
MRVWVWVSVYFEFECQREFVQRCQDKSVCVLVVCLCVCTWFRGLIPGTIILNKQDTTTTATS